MKYLFFTVTIALQFLSILTLKLLDSFWLIIAIFLLCLVLGGVLNFSTKKANTGITHTLGWGLFFGSMTSLALVVVFIIWLSFNFPK